MGRHICYDSFHNESKKKKETGGDIKQELGCRSRRGYTCKQSNIRASVLPIVQHYIDHLL